MLNRSPGFVAGGGEKPWCDAIVVAGQSLSGVFVDMVTNQEHRSVLLGGVNREALGRLLAMTGRTVVVTGGNRGIGLALAEGYVLGGARVVVASRKPDACEQAAEHLRGLGGEALG